MFSKILSGQINWDKADPDQKLEALGNVPSNDPLLEKLALHDTDERVRRKAFERAWRRYVTAEEMRALQVAFSAVITNMEELPAAGSTGTNGPTKG